MSAAEEISTGKLRARRLSAGNIVFRTAPVLDEHRGSSDTAEPGKRRQRPATGLPYQAHHDAVYGEMARPVTSPVQDQRGWENQAHQHEHQHEHQAAAWKEQSGRLATPLTYKGEVLEHDRGYRPLSSMRLASHPRPVSGFGPRGESSGKRFLFGWHTTGLTGSNVRETWGSRKYLARVEYRGSAETGLFSMSRPGTASVAAVVVDPRWQDSLPGRAGAASKTNKRPYQAHFPGPSLSASAPAGRHHGHGADGGDFGPVGYDEFEHGENGLSKQEKEMRMEKLLERGERRRGVSAAAAQVTRSSPSQEKRPRQGSFDGNSVAVRLSPTKNRNSNGNRSKGSGDGRSTSPLDSSSRDGRSASPMSEDRNPKQISPGRGRISPITGEWKRVSPLSSARKRTSTSPKSWDTGRTSPSSRSRSTDRGEPDIARPRPITSPGRVSTSRQRDSNDLFIDQPIGNGNDGGAPGDQPSWRRASPVGHGNGAEDGAESDTDGRPKSILKGLKRRTSVDVRRGGGDVENDDGEHEYEDEEEEGEEEEEEEEESGTTRRLPSSGKSRSPASERGRSDNHQDGTQGVLESLSGDSIMDDMRNGQARQVTRLGASDMDVKRMKSIQAERLRELQGQSNGGASIDWGVSSQSLGGSVGKGSFGGSMKQVKSEPGARDARRVSNIEIVKNKEDSTEAVWKMGSEKRLLEMRRASGAEGVWRNDDKTRMPAKQIKEEEDVWFVRPKDRDGVQTVKHDTDVEGVYSAPRPRGLGAKAQGTIHVPSSRSVRDLRSRMVQGGAEVGGFGRSQSSGVVEGDGAAERLSRKRSSGLLRRNDNDEEDKEPGYVEVQVKGVVKRAPSAKRTNSIKNLVPPEPPRRGSLVGNMWLGVDEPSEAEKKEIERIKVKQKELMDKKKKGIFSGIMEKGIRPITAGIFGQRKLKEGDLEKEEEERQRGGQVAGSGQKAKVRPLTASSAEALGMSSMEFFKEAGGAPLVGPMFDNDEGRGAAEGRPGATGGQVDKTVSKKGLKKEGGGDVVGGGKAPWKDRQVRGAANVGEQKRKDFSSSGMPQLNKAVRPSKGLLQEGVLLQRAPPQQHQRPATSSGGYNARPGSALTVTSSGGYNARPGSALTVARPGTGGGGAAASVRGGGSVAGGGVGRPATSGGVGGRPSTSGGVLDRHMGRRGSIAEVGGMSSGAARRGSSARPSTALENRPIDEGGMGGEEAEVEEMESETEMAVEGEKPGYRGDGGLVSLVRNDEGEDEEEDEEKEKKGKKKKKAVQQEEPLEVRMTRRKSDAMLEATTYNGVNFEKLARRGRICVRIPQGVKEGETISERWDDGRVFSYVVPREDALFAHPEDPDVWLATVRPIGWDKEGIYAEEEESTDEEERERRAEEIRKKNLRKQTKVSKYVAGDMVRGGVNHQMMQVTLRQEAEEYVKPKSTSIAEAEFKSAQVDPMKMIKSQALLKRIENRDGVLWCKICKKKFPSDCTCSNFMQKGDTHMGMQGDLKVNNSYLMDSLGDYDAAVDG